MRKFALITAIASVTSVVGALPALAEDGGNAFPSRPAVTLAQLDVCVGPDCQRSYRERRNYDRYYGYDDDRRYRDDWRYRRGDHCRDVTVRERRGDHVVVRHERRCD
jgi:hypothetical protein